jgi:hypothetical protein
MEIGLRNKILFVVNGCHYERSEAICLIDGDELETFCP